MGSHSGSKRRFDPRAALRWERTEAALLVLGIVLITAGIALVRNVSVTTDRVLHDGTCLTADVTQTGTHKSRAFGQTAQLAFAFDGRQHTATLHYDREAPLHVGDQLPLCIASDNATIFAIDTDAWNGESSQLWWRENTGELTSAIGLAILIIMLSRHPWRTPTDYRE